MSVVTEKICDLCGKVIEPAMYPVYYDVKLKVLRKEKIFSHWYEKKYDVCYRCMDEFRVFIAKKEQK